jgi:hypothetical protein
VALLIPVMLIEASLLAAVPAKLQVACVTTGVPIVGLIHETTKAASTVNTSFLVGSFGFTMTASDKPVVGLKSESVASVEPATFCLVLMVQVAGKLEVMILT